MVIIHLGPVKFTAGQPKSNLAGPIGQPGKKLSMTPVTVLAKLLCFNAIEHEYLIKNGNIFFKSNT